MPGPGVRGVIGLSDVGTGLPTPVKMNYVNLMFQTFILVLHQREVARDLKCKVIAVTLLDVKVSDIYFDKLKEQHFFKIFVSIFLYTTSRSTASL